MTSASTLVRAAADGLYLRDLLGVRFTDEQLAVVTASPEPQLVIAGAGSGKTTVMAARVVHAVAWQGVRPDAVLGLTFTNKAATELAERVRVALATLVQAGLLATVSSDPDTATADDQPTVSTYHAYAAALIKDHALRIGREPDARLLTEAARWQLALRVVQSARGPFEHLDWTTPTVAQYVIESRSWFLSCARAWGWPRWRTTCCPRRRWVSSVCPGMR